MQNLNSDIQNRVEELLAKMTLEEKVGQLVQVDLYKIPDLETAIQEGHVGSLLSSFEAEKNNRLQKAAVEGSRLGIPLMVGNDVIHGYRTVFPIPLALSCTWNPELVERVTRIAAEEAATNGTSWIYAPMVDVSREPRWGRIAEGAGEDPYLGGILAQAQVRGIQSADLTNGWQIVACPKHYAAYGAVEGGREYNTVDVSERTLRDLFLPPFKAAFEAGAATVMSAFNELSGIPATANAFILKTVLRDEWGFDGVVVSDYSAVAELINHGIAADMKDAARLSILAGLDVDMMSNAYLDYLPELVNEGTVPIEAVDQAARRVLQLKFQLGLFEKPYVDETLGPKVILKEESRAAAREAAEKVAVLLKNEGNLLPLKPGRQKIALVGPLGDNRESLLGTWAGQGQPADVVSILEGLRNLLGNSADLVFEAGCAIEGDSAPDFTLALDAARQADVVILAVGESAAMSGEGHSRAIIGLPGHQQALVDALAATGKPLVGVVLSGRPLALTKMTEQVSALLFAWHGGVEAGPAIANLLFGKANPSGRLSVSFPWTEGQIPVYYAQKNTGRPIEKSVRQFTDEYKSFYLDAPNSARFPFGFGLSYSRFDYSDLQVETPEVALDGALKVSVTIGNSGGVAGEETVQLYVRDLVGSVTRPIKELKGYRKVVLQPGESQRVRFEVPVSSLGFSGLDLKYVVEPGDFKVWVGPDSASGLESTFKVI